MAAAGRREISDRVLSEAGVEDEAIRPKIAIENIVVQAAVEDIGGAIAALLSPDNVWVNGQRIEVSGGMSL